MLLVPLFFPCLFLLRVSCLLVVGDSYPPSTSESSTIMANEFAVAITHLYSFSSFMERTCCLTTTSILIICSGLSMHHNAQHPPCVLIPCVCARSPAHATLRMLRCMRLEGHCQHPYSLLSCTSFFLHHISCKKKEIDSGSDVVIF